jgi:hypothetical protein
MKKSIVVVENCEESKVLELSMMRYYEDPILYNKTFASCSSSLWYETLN